MATRDQLIKWGLSALPIYFFGATNGWLIKNGSASDFQRFGTVSIVVGVTLYALSASHFLRQREPATSDAVFWSREFRAGEVFLVVVGTLQTGYGDILHQWLQGKGS